MNTRNAIIFAAALLVAAPVFGEVESFDAEPADLQITFNDFGDQATEVGKTFGTEPGLTLHEGTLAFYDNSRFGDVGVAYRTLGNSGDGFRLAVDVDVEQINYTQSKIGLFAHAQRPDNFEQKLAGLFAYVQEIDTSGRRFRLVLTRGDGEAVEELAASDEFDLTDGSPDFRLEMVGTPIDDGLEIGVRLVQDGEPAFEPLVATVGRGDVPDGNQFGLRVNPAFNTLEVAFDNLLISSDSGESR